MYPAAAKGRLSVVVKERIKSNPSARPSSLLLKQRFIENNDYLPGYQRLMLISSANISSAVVMIFEDAE